LQFLPRNLQLGMEVRDRPSWIWDAKRIFSVRSAYRWLNDGGLRCPFSNAIWGY